MDFCLKSKSIIMCKEKMKLSEEQLIVKFFLLKTGKFLIRWIILNICGFVTVFVFNSKEMNRKSFSLAYLCKMLLLRMLQLL
jgi:hypothetical protein